MPLTSAAAQLVLMSWSVHALPFTARTTAPYVGAATSVAELAPTLSWGSVPASAPPAVAFTPITSSRYPAGNTARATSSPGTADGNASIGPAAPRLPVSATTRTPASRTACTAAASSSSGATDSDTFAIRMPCCRAFAATHRSPAAREPGVSTSPSRDSGSRVS